MHLKTWQVVGVGKLLSDSAELWHSKYGCKNSFVAIIKSSP